MCMLYLVRVYRGIIITKVFSSESEILMTLMSYAYLDIHIRRDLGLSMPPRLQPMRRIPSQESKSHTFLPEIGYPGFCLDLQSSLLW